MRSLLDLKMQLHYQKSEEDAFRHAKRRQTFLKRMLSVKKFDSLISTEDYNAVDEPQFYGKYAHIRKMLDYTYHSHYRKERQWLQDSIIEDMLDNVDDGVDCVTPVEPWLIFTVGPRGAGKKQAIRNLVFEGHLELLTYIDVDPDSIRRRLPEYDTYVKMSPHKVDELTRKEAGLICEILTLAGLQAGRNVIVDGGLRDSKWHLELINKLKKEYPFLKFGIFHITAPLQHIIKHSRKKAIETGHEISEISITRCINSIPNSLKILKPAVDFTCEIHNGEDECELVGHIEWEDFEQTFAQACAWKPGMHGKQKRNVSGNQSFIARQASVKISKILRKRFSVFISSEDNNAVGEMNFFGEYSHIRKTLDYSYHKNYTFERQKLQDAIINDMLDSAFILDADGKVGTVPTNPWIVFTAGAMGAGKSHVMNILVEKGRFPLRAFVIVDPDEIRRLLPEYHMYINENAELAGELTRKEAGFIAEILTLAALQGGKNVLQDGSLRDAVWYKTYFLRLKEEFPALRQSILHVTAPRDAVFKRAAARAIETGRIVPKGVLEAALEQVPRSVQALSPLVDYYAEIDNAENAPDVELVKPPGSNWEEFRVTWLQTVAYASNRQKLLEKVERQLKSNGRVNGEAVCKE